MSWYYIFISSLSQLITSSEIIDYAWVSNIIQSNLYKTTTLGTTQKWTFCMGGCLIKHLYKMTTNQLDQLLVFIPIVNGLYTIKICWNKDLQFGVFWCHSWRLKLFLVTFDFEHTYVKKWCHAGSVYKWE